MSSLRFVRSWKHLITFSSLRPNKNTKCRGAKPEDFKDYSEFSHMWNFYSLARSVFIFAVKRTEKTFITPKTVTSSIQKPHLYGALSAVSSQLLCNSDVKTMSLFLLPAVELLLLLLLFARSKRMKMSKLRFGTTLRSL